MDEKYYHPDCSLISCGECQKKISPDEASLEIFGKSLHAHCFTCIILIFLLFPILIIYIFEQT